MAVCICGFELLSHQPTCPKCGKKYSLDPVLLNQSLPEPPVENWKSGLNAARDFTDESLREVQLEAKQREKIRKQQLASQSKSRKNLERLQRKSRRNAFRRRTRIGLHSSSLLARILRFAVASLILTALINPSFSTEVYDKFNSIKSNITALATFGEGSGCLMSMDLANLDSYSNLDPTNLLINAAIKSRKSAKRYGYQETIEVNDPSLLGDYPSLTPRQIVIARLPGRHSKMAQFDGVGVSDATSTNGAASIAMYDLLLANARNLPIVTEEQDGTLRFGQAGSFLGLGPDIIFRFALKEGRIIAWCQELPNSQGKHNRGWSQYGLDALGDNIASMLNRSAKPIRNMRQLGASNLRGKDMVRMGGTDITNSFPVNFGQSQVLKIHNCPLFITPDAGVQSAVLRGMAQFSDFDAVVGQNYVLVDSALPGSSFGCSQDFAVALGVNVESHSWQAR